VAGAELVGRGYRDITEANAPTYLWHEFGDSMLLLP
jgi:S-adenosylmethionine:tRNA ribosyltransferase-isomerase